MINQTKKQRGTRFWALSLISLLILSIFILSACGNQAAEGVTIDEEPVQTEEEAVVATVAVEVEPNEAEAAGPVEEDSVNSASEPVEEADVSILETNETETETTASTVDDETTSPAADAVTSEEAMTEEDLNEAVTQNERDAAVERSDLNVSMNQKIEFMFEDMTFVRLESEEYARVETVCAGTGLNYIEPLADEPTILIPNAGDLSVDGSNVAIKMSPDREITFIPRTTEQLIRVPVDLGDKQAGEEVLSLNLAEAKQLFDTGHLIWTAEGLGPYGTGQGIAGHIAECDPLYEES